MTSGRLQGGRAFITGDGGGLTAEIARAFARAGGQLVLASSSTTGATIAGVSEPDALARLVGTPEAYLGETGQGS